MPHLQILHYILCTLSMRGPYFSSRHRSYKGIYFPLRKRLEFTLVRLSYQSSFCFHIYSPVKTIQISLQKDHSLLKLIRLLQLLEFAPRNPSNFTLIGGLILYLYLLELIWCKSDVQNKQGFHVKQMIVPECSQELLQVSTNTINRLV